MEKIYLIYLDPSHPISELHKGRKILMTERGRVVKQRWSPMSKQGHPGHWSPVPLHLGQ